MQIVTDSGTDLCLPAEEVEKLNIHVLPLVVTLEGKSYREGVDMNAEDFYKLLAADDRVFRPHLRRLPGILRRLTDVWRLRTPKFYRFI